MGRGREEFLGRYGGFRPGETEAQLKERTAEIDRLEGLFKSGLILPADLERTQRRLCELKGIDFDADDDDDGDWD